MSYCNFVNNLKDNDQPLHKSYHDTRYGFEIDNDDELFCRLVLEINQAGLSWNTILVKEDNFRKAYHHFSIKKVAGYKEKDIQRLLNDTGIIRNKLKINAAIFNANAIIALQKQYGSFKKWLDQNHPKEKLEWVKLFKNTFKFTGGEIVGEFLMSTGYLAGAHDSDCPIYKKLAQKKRFNKVTKEIKKFVIVGPESTGKSTLSQNLANHFKTEWVREYAREYLELNGTDYTFENLYDIAQGQLAGEEAIYKKLQEANTGTPLIIDTDMYVIKVWSEFVFNKCDNRILTAITTRKYDGYILSNTDVPWVKDNLREYPDLATREKLFHFYKEELSEQKTPWIIINGGYEERTQQAINFISSLL
jgi:DNA-3-methyladenine glycosylase I